MKTSTCHDDVLIGEWRASASAGGIERDGELRRLEPKVLDLLFLLASRNGEVVSRDEIHSALWPDVVVGDDALPRCISKLRRALDDDAQEPRYIQTVPKRGYRLLVGASPPAASSPPSRWRTLALSGLMILLLAALSWLAGASWLAAPESEPPVADTPAQWIEQGLVYYSRYTRQDNESAIDLFERALAADPGNAQAMAALANALGQRALRWPDEQSAPPPEHSTLTRALGEGRLALPNARLNLDAARALAERSVQAAPESSASYKALGLILSAQGEIDAAIGTYERALEYDPKAWGVMINLSELYGLKGDAVRELELLESAYALQPRYAELGVLIGSRHEKNGQLQEAKLRYRNVLNYAPFHHDATLALARVLTHMGERAEASRYCERLIDRTGDFPPCRAYVLD